MRSVKSVVLPLYRSRVFRHPPSDGYTVCSNSGNSRSLTSLIALTDQENVLNPLGVAEKQ